MNGIDELTPEQASRLAITARTVGWACPCPWRTSIFREASVPAA